MASYVQLDLRTELADRMRSYWDPDKDPSFNKLTQRLDACAQQTLKAQKQYEETFTPQNAPAQRLLLKGFVDEVRKIEEDLSPAHELCREGARMTRNENTQLKGELDIFTKRVATLDSDISKIYENTFYPYLLAIQNGEQKWHPAGIICKIYDLYSLWQVQNPKALIDEAFPKKRRRA